LFWFSTEVLARVMMTFLLCTSPNWPAFATSASGPVPSDFDAHADRHRWIRMAPWIGNGCQKSTFGQTEVGYFHTSTLKRVDITSTPFCGKRTVGRVNWQVEMGEIDGRRSCAELCFMVISFFACIVPSCAVRGSPTSPPEHSAPTAPTHRCRIFRICATAARGDAISVSWGCQLPGVVEFRLERFRH
jgi:hypothetical protein